MSKNSWRDISDLLQGLVLMLIQTKDASPDAEKVVFLKIMNKIDFLDFSLTGSNTLA